MEYVFRADGNAKIGVGHIMRCLTIADALSDMVEIDKIRFITSDEESAKIVNKYGFRFTTLYTSYDNLEEEISKWENLNISNSVIVVDSYYVTDSYLDNIKKYGRVVLIDDFQRHTYPVNTIINYNVYADINIYNKLYGNKCELYIGEKYVPVRRQFLNCEYTVKTNVNNVLITTGGGDIFNIAKNIYDRLSAIDLNINYHIISGVFNPYYSILKEIEENNLNLTVYQNVEEMAAIMQQCDLAITAGGSTIYELAAVGVPMVCFSYAENQEKLVEYIDENISDYAGSYIHDAEQTINNIADIFVNKMMDYNYRLKCSEKGKKMIDGKGAERIADALIKCGC